MAKALFLLTLYATAFYFIFVGVALAPNMTWPHSEAEKLATAMICAGLVIKTAAHFIFLSYSRAAVR